MASSAPWDPEEIRKHAKNWNLEGDAKMLELMEQIGKKVQQRALQTTKKMNEFVINAEFANVALGNAQNKLCALQQKQFVEHRVYDDDETIANSSEVPIPDENASSREEEIKDPNELVREILEKCVEALEQWYEKVEITIDDSDDEDPPVKSYEYRLKETYHTKNLPALIGSEEWIQKRHCGILESDEDFSEDENVEEYSSTSSENPSLSASLPSAAPTESEYSGNKAQAARRLHPSGDGADTSTDDDSSSIAASNISKPAVLESKMAPKFIENDPLDSRYYIHKSRERSDLFDRSSDESEDPKVQPIPPVAASVSTKRKVNSSKTMNFISDEPPPDFDETDQQQRSSAPNKLFQDSDDDGETFKNSLRATKKTKETISSIGASSTSEIKKKTVNLFDDDDFDSFMKELETKTIAQKVNIVESKNLFDDEDDVQEKDASAPTQKAQSLPVRKEIERVKVFPIKPSDLQLPEKIKSSPAADLQPKDQTIEKSALRLPSTKTKNLFDSDSDDKGDGFDTFISKSGSKNVKSNQQADIFAESPPAAGTFKTKASKSETPENLIAEPPAVLESKLPSEARTPALRKLTDLKNLFSDDSDDEFDNLFKNQASQKVKANSSNPPEHDVIITDETEKNPDLPSTKEMFKKIEDTSTKIKELFKSRNMFESSDEDEDDFQSILGKSIVEKDPKYQKMIEQIESNAMKPENLTSESKDYTVEQNSDQFKAQSSKVIKRTENTPKKLESPLLRELIKRKPLFSSDEESVDNENFVEEPSKTDASEPKMSSEEVASDSRNFEAQQLIQSRKLNETDENGLFNKIPEDGPKSRNEAIETSQENYKSSIKVKELFENIDDADSSSTPKSPAADKGKDISKESASLMNLDNETLPENQVFDTEYVPGDQDSTTILEAEQPSYSNSKNIIEEKSKLLFSLFDDGPPDEDDDIFETKARLSPEKASKPSSNQSAAIQEPKSLLTSKSRNPISFLDDLPPDDDDSIDNIFGIPKSESKISAHLSIFDDIPPDDDDFPSSINADIPKRLHTIFSEDFSEPGPSSSMSMPVPSKSSLGFLFNDDIPPFEFDIANEELLKSNSMLLTLDDEKLKNESKDSRSATTDQIFTTGKSIHESLNVLELTKDDTEKAKENREEVDNISSKISRLTEELKNSEEKSSMLEIKRQTPGKLNSNLSINVAALLPGAKRPNSKLLEQGDNIFITKNSVHQVPSSSNDVHNSKDLLSTPKNITHEESAEKLRSLNKSRPKIQIKRRPSTRSGRQESYRKSLANAEDEDAKESEQQQQDENDGLSTAIKERDLEINNDQVKLFDEQRIVDSIKALTISSEAADDENTEQKIIKNKEKEADVPSSKNVQTLAKFPDALSTNKILFADALSDDEDDLFGSMSSAWSVEQEEKSSKSKTIPEKEWKSKEIAKKSTTTSKIKSSIFSDDEDDDLFGGGAIGSKKIPATKTTKNEIKSLANKPAVEGRLFDDIDEDDDDIFSTKSSAIEKPTKITLSETNKRMKSVKINPPKPFDSKVSNDNPLSDLLDE